MSEKMPQLSPTPLDKVKEFLRFIVTLTVVVFGTRIFIFEPFNIPTGSMIPTLLVGDYLIVSKFTYGLSRYSFPFGYKIPFFKGRILDFHKPERGDVAVFRLPATPHIDYIKRVIGLPGDRIQMREGIPYVNNQPAILKDGGAYEEKAEEGGRIVQAQKYIETLLNGKSHPIIKHQALGEGPVDDTPVYVVPEGHYFMMGDNRDHSLDSRYMHQIGFIPEENLVGRAEILFFSLDDDTIPFWQIWKIPFSIRFKRLLNLIN
ncbi:MAG: signal peptidase I [Alphaproteobacteria bacterium]